jgi:hypothetical protein
MLIDFSQANIQVSTKTAAQFFAMPVTTLG